MKGDSTADENKHLHSLLHKAEVEVQELNRKLKDLYADFNSMRDRFIYMRNESKEAKSLSEIAIKKAEEAGMEVDTKKRKITELEIDIMRKETIIQNYKRMVDAKNKQLHRLTIAKKVYIHKKKYTKMLRLLKNREPVLSSTEESRDEEDKETEVVEDSD